jgi:transcription antitermination factor NusG
MSLFERHNEHLAQLGEKEFYNWYLLQLCPTKEKQADEALVKQGFSTYLPLTLSHKRKGESRETLPLYPGYMFVYLCAGIHGDDFHPVKITPSVTRFVTYGMDGDRLNYAIASDDLISAMKQQENDMGLRDLGPEYKEHDQIRVKSGPFKDYIGEVIRFSERDQAIMVMLEGKVKAKYKRSEIEPIA